MSIRSSLQKSLKQFERRLITYNNITLSRSALLHNFDIFQKLVPNGSVFPV